MLLARIQFAFTIAFHIIFPAISIGLAAFLAQALFIVTFAGFGISIYTTHSYWVFRGKVASDANS